MLRRYSLLIATALVLVSMAGAAVAASVTAAPWIQAREDGKYIVSMSVHAGDSDVTLQSEYLLGLINSDEDRMRDLACDLTIPAGESYYFIFEGYLADPEANGLVELGVMLCDQTMLSAEIEIYHAGIVGSESGTLDSIKALYR